MYRMKSRAGDPLKTVLLTAAVLLAVTSAAQAQGQPFSARVTVSPAQALPGAQATLTVHYQVPPGHLIYRDMCDVVVAPDEAFTAGEAVWPAGHLKQDPFGDEQRLIYEESFQVTVPLQIAQAGYYGKKTVSAKVSWQGCDATVCYFPTTVDLTADFTISGRPTAPPPPSEAAASPAAGAPSMTTGAAGQGDLQDFSEQQPAASSSGGLLDFGAARGRGFLWMYIAAFLGGILTSLTPCVLPIVPLTITVIGARGAESRMKAFALSMVYVLGIAFTYATLGVVAATTGALFGSLFQSTWFLIFAIALFTLLAFGLFGAYELQLPAPIRNRLMAKQGKGWGGIFIMGLIAGLVASPCVGPVLVGVLAFIAQTGSVPFGFSLLFVFAMGMGVLFLVVGTFSSEIKRMPSGPWMTAIENGLGVLMMGVAFYYLNILLDPFWFAILLGASLVTGGVYAGAFLQITPETVGWGPKARKALGILAVAAGLYFFVGGMMTHGVFLPPMSGVGSGQTMAGGAAGAPAGQGTASEAAGVTWGSDLEAALIVAEIENKPVIIDFTADWCVACKELDHFTFSDPAVVEAFKDFILVRIDMTDSATPQSKEYQKRYEIYGLPSVTFLTPSGRMLGDLTITGFLKAPAFLDILARARSASGLGM